jgi:hypothetical protein
MDKQTVYKEGGQYYQIHRERLLKEGYQITQDTKEYTVFEKEDNQNKTYVNTQNS